MKYTTTNVKTSMTLALADFLRAKGYDVLWHASGETEGQTAGLDAPKATVTLVPEFPANAAFIVRLKGDSAGAEEIVIPAFAVHVALPRRDSIQGLGHSDYTWMRDLRVDGLAADEFQQTDLAELLHEWLQSVEDKQFVILDYTSDAADPSPLDPLWIEHADPVWSTELVGAVEAVRFYTRATAVMSYIE
jgi:hypothetical protein